MAVSVVGGPRPRVRIWTGADREPFCAEECLDLFQNIQSEAMVSSGVLRNIFIWLWARDAVTVRAPRLAEPQAESDRTVTAFESLGLPA